LRNQGDFVKKRLGREQRHRTFRATTAEDVAGAAAGRGQATGRDDRRGGNGGRRGRGGGGRVAARAGAAWDKAARPAVPFFIWGPLFVEGLDPEPSAKIFLFFLFNFFAEGQHPRPSAKMFSFYFRRRHPVQNICRGPVQRALGKEFYFFISKFFAEGLTPSPRQRLTAGAAVTLGRGRREAVLCRGPGPRQRWAFAVGR